MWFRQDKKSPLEIAKLLHRAKSTITRYLFQQRAKALGRPVVITPAVLDKILVNLKKYIETAKNRSQDPENSMPITTVLPLTLYT